MWALGLFMHSKAIAHKWRAHTQIPINNKTESAIHFSDPNSSHSRFVKTFYGRNVAQPSIKKVPEVPYLYVRILRKQDREKISAPAFILWPNRT